MNREHRTTVLKKTAENVRDAYTPGSWKIMPGKSAPRICVDGDKEWPIVVTISGHSPQGIKANENLIAAAPTLLKVLKKALEDHQIADPHHHELCDLCRDMDGAIISAEPRS